MYHCQTTDRNRGNNYLAFCINTFIDFNATYTRDETYSNYQNQWIYCDLLQPLMVTVTYVTRVWKQANLYVVGKNIHGVRI